VTRSLCLLAIGGALHFIGHVSRLSPQQTGNEAILAKYSQSLRPGATRRQVEDLLRDQNAYFVHSSPGTRGSPSTLVQVQREDRWLLTDWYVFATFNFSGGKEVRDGHVLTRITLARIAGGA
jgi:hypothetical protein